MNESADTNDYERIMEEIHRLEQRRQELERANKRKQSNRTKMRLYAITMSIENLYFAASEAKSTEKYQYIAKRSRKRKKKY